MNAIRRPTVSQAAGPAMEPRLAVRAFVLPTLLAIWLVPAPALAQAGPTEPRIAAAEQLVQHIRLEDTSYAHGPGSVSWTEPVASRTDCSGLIDHLLMHVDGYTPDDFRRWFGTQRPTAERYHDAIASGRGFTALRAISDLRRGDVIAIKYFTRKDNTGHIMLVDEPPRRMEATPPLVDGTMQWEVTVIDSSESGHGATDTRHKRGEGGHDHDGLGRGVFRLYSDSKGEVVGFAWSTLKVSRFVAPDDEPVVLGRFVEGYRP